MTYLTLEGARRRRFRDIRIVAEEGLKEKGTGDLLGRGHTLMFQGRPRLGQGTLGRGLRCLFRQVQGSRSSKILNNVNEETKRKRYLVMGIVVDDLTVDAGLLEFVLLRLGLRGVMPLKLTNRQPILVDSIFLVRKMNLGSSQEPLTPSLEALVCNCLLLSHRTGTTYLFPENPVAAEDNRLEL